MFNIDYISIHYYNHQQNSNVSGCNILNIDLNEINDQNFIFAAINFSNGKCNIVLCLSMLKELLNSSLKKRHSRQ